MCLSKPNAQQHGAQDPVHETGIWCYQLYVDPFEPVSVASAFQSGFMCVGLSRKAPQHAGRDPVQKDGIRFGQVCVGPTGLNRIPVQLNRIPVQAWVPSSEVVVCVLSQSDSHGIWCKKTEFGSARFVQTLQS